MWWFLALIILALLDEGMRQLVRFKAWRAGYRAPTFLMSRPFGIPAFFKMFRASINDLPLEHTQDKYDKLNRKTLMQQFSFDMEYLTCDKENIKALLSTQFKDFDLGLREENLGYFVGSGIFTQSGERWKHSRAMLRPQFARQLVAQLESVNHHVDILVEKLLQGRCDFQELFHRLTMDTATEFLFGESTDTLSDSHAEKNGVSAQQFVQDYKSCLQYSLIRFMLGPLYWLFRPKTFREKIARSRKYVDYFVQRGLIETSDASNEKERYTFSYELAKVTRDPVVIRDQLFNILIAGHDTTANLLGYVVWYMGHYPDVWTHLRESILQEFPVGGPEPTFETIKRCALLTQIINEVLRLHPIVPRNIRFAVRDTTLPRGGGPDESEPVFVAKGTAVSYTTYSLQRDPEYWGEDAADFRPSRWADSTPPTWAYVPFSGGPRVCLGQQFALTEASLTVIRLAQKFRAFDLDEPELRHPKNKPELTSQVSGGVWGRAII